ncbi:ATP-grasp domain-containing protein [Tessaracoccus flavus]|uniref:Uncharacterized protein n=1 Tax=Tessaracoccus flavus TaxID=1610493 RepID=A0A1Q2CFR4_9ACTN|nr:hypothetical protein [Tessaracoccus flavus]AQP44956.1 hypothetical protein RPIT_09290 [Tessaracoccus flavus]SDY61122.1 [lysine-biosynthesis-protein LysW]---L-2-aminoadipate ligase/ribosomal protein S6--L-glutamate ligase [Tessaracoccus flavus]
MSGPTDRRPLVMVLGDDIDDLDHSVLFPALRARGVEVTRVHPRDLVTYMDGPDTTFAVGGQTIRPDLVVGWVLDDLLLQGMAQLDVLARAGIVIINDAITLFRAQNNYINSSLLSDGGVLRYPVISGEDPQALRDWASEHGYPVVVKPVRGFGGRGLRRLLNDRELEDLLGDLRQDDEQYYVVPWVENPGRDIRVYTVAHHPVFAMYRYAPPGSWVTNILAGGEKAMCPLNDRLADLAERASRAAGTLLGGVDLAENLETGDLVVYEVNSCPSSEPAALEAVADFLVSVVEQGLDAAVASWRPARVHDHFNPDRSLFHRTPRERLHRS